MTTSYTGAISAIREIRYAANNAGMHITNPNFADIYEYAARRVVVSHSYGKIEGILDFMCETQFRVKVSDTIFVAFAVIAIRELILSEDSIYIHLS